MVEPIGFVPTEWLPISMAFTGGKLYVATDKGKGTGPNNFPQRRTPQTTAAKKLQGATTYIATLLYGSMVSLDMTTLEKNLPRGRQRCSSPTA